MSYIIATDGSYRKTTNKASWAFAIFDQNNNQIYEMAKLVEPFEIINISENIEYTNKSAKPTNNRGELLAILASINYIKLANLEHKKYIILSDSKYSIGVYTEWYKNWNKNGTKTGKLNLDIIELTVSLFKELSKIGYKFQFRWINAHIPKYKFNELSQEQQNLHLLNEKVDNLANTITL